LQTVRHRYTGSCVALALSHGDGHRKLVTHRCNTASIMKGLV